MGSVVVFRVDLRFGVVVGTSFPVTPASLELVTAGAAAGLRPALGFAALFVTGTAGVEPLGDEPGSPASAATAFAERVVRRFGAARLVLSAAATVPRSATPRS